LNVTRIERGALTFHPEKVDMAKEIRQVIDDSKFSAEDKNIEVQYGGMESGAYIAADQIALREVVGNLVSNAIKYTDKGGKVSIGLRDEGERYKVFVKDTGIGIPEKAIPNLFTKFFRAHSGLNSGNPGTGLGLFIAKSILERHEGTISVQSKEGVGSVFSFTIPKWSEKRLNEMKTGELEVESNIRRHRGWVAKDSSS
jgi:signal transduction histidine kinase